MRTLLVAWFILLSVVMVFQACKDNGPSVPEIIGPGELEVRFGLPNFGNDTVEVSAVDEDGDNVSDGVDLTEDELIDMYFILDENGNIIGLDKENDGVVDFYVTYDKASHVMHLHTEAGRQGMEVFAVVDENGDIVGMDTDGDGEADVHIRVTDWRNIGPDYWLAYKMEWERMIAAGVSGEVEVSTFGDVGGSSYKYMGGVLAPNGKIYCIPYFANSVLEIDPVTIVPSKEKLHFKFSTFFQRYNNNRANHL